MGCGCGKKFSSASGASRQAVSSSAPYVPPQVQRSTLVDNARVVKSEQTPYRNGLRIQRRVV